MDRHVEIDQHLDFCNVSTVYFLWLMMYSYANFHQTEAAALSSMRPDAAASMPAFSIVHPSTRTRLIISPIPARCPFPEWMKTGKLAGSLAAFKNGSIGAGSSV